MAAVPVEPADGGGGPGPHPPGAPGSRRWYAKGCRCGDCSRANADAARAYRRQMAMGGRWPGTRVPGHRAAAAVAAMRRSGMTWPGIQELVGVDRRNLQRLLQLGCGITLSAEQRVLAAHRRLLDDPRLAGSGRRLVGEGERLRWMMGCLMANGWTSGWIGEQIGRAGWPIGTAVGGEVVNVRTAARLEGVFKAYHMEWGPARAVAVRSWRSGRFPSACYDWEDGESGYAAHPYRPIPGTLHPDLVREACTFGRTAAPGRAGEVLSEMHRVYGQWESERCAAAAMRTWQRAVGEPPGDGPVCGQKSHRHDLLPELWRGTAARAS